MPSAGQEERRGEEEEGIEISSLEYSEKINSNLICCICGEPFFSPVSSISCGHTFCLICISSALSLKETCPVDRSPLTVEDLRPAAQIISNLVNELKVFCPNKREGCQEILERSNLSAHLRKECHYVILNCPNHPCQISTTRKELSQHLDNCQFKRSTCHLCGEEVQEAEIKDHLEESCKETEISCPRCEKKMRRNLLLSSHLSECPLAEISCLHQRFGCATTLFRMELDAHLKVCPFEALKDFFFLQEKKNQELEASLAVCHQKIRAIEEEFLSFKQNRGQEISQTNEQLALENGALNQKIDALHEEMRTQDLFKTGEILRMREEIEGLKAHCQVLQIQTSRLILESHSLMVNKASSGSLSSNPSQKKSLPQEADILKQQGNKL